MEKWNYENINENSLPYRERWLWLFCTIFGWLFFEWHFLKCVTRYTRNNNSNYYTQYFPFSRGVFHVWFQTAIIAWVFVFFDFIADVVYLLDIAVQFHTAYLEDGIIVSIHYSIVSPSTMQQSSVEDFTISHVNFRFFNSFFQVRDQAKLWTNYRQKSYFSSDVIAVFPLNFISCFLQGKVIISSSKLIKLSGINEVSLV